MPAPFGPVMPIRSPALTCRDTGPKAKSPRCRVASLSVATTELDRGADADAELQRPLLARLLDLVEPGDPGLHLADLLGLLLRRLGLGLAADLVVVRALLHRVADALAAPLPLGPGPSHEVGLGGGVLVVRLPRVPPRDLPLGQERVVAAVVDRHLVLREVELDDPVDAAGQELAVVRDEHDAAAQPADERLEPLEAGEVEVVGGLVEQHDVEAAQQQRREGGPGGLAAGQRGHQRVRRDVGPEVGEHRRDPLVEVGGAAGEPVVEGAGVLVVDARLPRAQLVGRPLHGGGGLRRAGTTGDVPGHGLAGHPLVLLRQPADERVARRGLHRAVQRRDVAGEQPQQRGLPGAVRPEHADHVAGADGQVEVLEQRAVRVTTGQVLGDEGGTHDLSPSGGGRGAAGGA